MSKKKNAINTVSIFNAVLESREMTHMDVARKGFSNTGRYTNKAPKSPTLNTLEKFFDATGVTFSHIVVKDSKGRTLKLK